MAWEFDYARAWSDWARVKYNELSNELMLLVHDTAMATKDMLQKDIEGGEWPAGLRERFAAIPDLLLGELEQIVHSYGHWFPGKPYVHWHDTPECKARWPAPWISPATIAGTELFFLPDNWGGHWRFSILAKRSLIERGYATSIRGWSNDQLMADGWFTHKEGTPVESDEAEYLLRPKVAPLFEMAGVQACNFKVDGQPGHPFTIGLGHFPGENDGPYIDVHKHGCYYEERKHGPKCGRPFEAHTHDTVLFLKLTRNCTQAEAQAVLKPIVPELESYKIDGIAFVDTPQQFRIGEQACSSQ